jgi:hypothetical protein
MKRGPVAGYLLSRRNLAGCALALVAAGLVLADPVGPAGWLLVAGFYVLGAAAATPHRPISPYGFDPKQVERALRDEITAVSGRVPPEIIMRIQRIEVIIRTQILPRLDSLPPGSLDLYLVERTARGYLPTAIEHYLRLPTGYTTSHTGDRSTALQAVTDQLDLMEVEMRRVAGGVQHTDMDSLLAHRRFLIDRFGRLDPSH